MHQYHEQLAWVLDMGVQVENRTGTDSIMVPGLMGRYDMADGFPAVTTKKLAFNGAKGELCGFLKGVTNAQDFADLGCGWWFDNANKNPAWLSNPTRLGEDDLGEIYGAQWRRWETRHGGKIDQIDRVIQQLRTDPSNRRILFHAWNVGELDAMALAPCHVLYQFIANPKMKELHLCMYQRSCDMFLGVPMNIATSAMMLHLFARAIGYTPRVFTHFMADAHIYVNHIQQVKAQLAREPYLLPTLKLHPTYEVLHDLTGAQICNFIQPSHFELVDYQHHDALPAPMAI